MKSVKSSSLSQSLIYLIAFLAFETVTHPLKSWADMNHGHGHPMNHSPSQSHSHEMLEIPASVPTPTLTLVLHPDQKKGWNLEIKTTNFKFEPEQVNQSSKLGEGHAHLYINGQKITRLYSNWYYLETLPSGKHEIMVELNDNQHRILSSQGKAIRQIISVDIPQ